MRRLCLHLLLPFLLLSQVLVGMSPGHAICIAIEACCGAHDHAAAPGLEHHAHVHAHAHACRGADATHAEACAHACSEGTCHIHVSLPDDGGSVRDRSHDHFCDLSLLPPALMVLAVDCGGARFASQTSLPPPWAWPACDRTIARETDRLVI